MVYRFQWANTLPKIVSFLIVACMLVAFQLPTRAQTGGKITVVRLSDTPEALLESMVQTLRKGGYQTEVIGESELSHAGMPRDTRYAMLPLSRDVRAETVNRLQNYLAGGGRLILLPPEAFPATGAVNRLLMMSGFKVSGAMRAVQPMSLQWKGATRPESATLPKDSRMLVIAPGNQVNVLATWGEDTPAVITSPKGAVLNWQWGKQLAESLNLEALSRIIAGTGPLATKPAPKTEKAKGVVATKSAPPKALEPQITPNPAMSVPGKPHQAASEKPTAKPVAAEPPPPAEKPAPQAAAPGKPADKANEAEDEVVRNILGQDQQGGEAPRQQKHFSFLDPEAADLVAPEFDYGVYSHNMRVLEDYRRRIEDALETSRQLSLNFPKDRVMPLLDQAQVHKRQFELLYLNGKTEEGLAQYDLAKRFTLQALALTTDSPRVEGRAIWLDRGTIIEAGSPEGIKALMQKLHNAGINVVYFETVNAGFPIYPSKRLRQNPLVNGWDPLKAAVEEGKRLGMEVHAWVWVFAVGNDRHNELIGKPGDYAGPILVEAGMESEALRNQSGGLKPDSRQHEYWLSPASPKARAFLLDLFKEIVTTYDVDGLQLDYIRYPFQSAATRMGYEPVGRERFYQSTGQSLDSLDDYKTKLWIAWKTYQVSSFVQQVSETLRAVRPDIQISAAVFPMQRESRIVAIQQDWETWIDNGWIDVLNPMSYTRDPDRLQHIYETVRKSPQKRVLIYPGIAIKDLDAGELVMELEALRAKGSMGATLFAGAHLDEEKIRTLGEGPFKERNSIPPHRDVVKSLQEILSDYHQKFQRLKNDGALQTMPVSAVHAIQSHLDQFGQALTGLGSGKNINAGRLPQVQQQFKALETATMSWVSQDRASHPFRAQYFEKSMLLLEHLLGYLVDHYANASAGWTAELAPASPDGYQPVRAPSYTMLETAD